MRLIPGKTKVQMELFKGVSLTDVLIGLAAMLLAIFVMISSLPGKLYIVIGIVFVAGILLARLDSEPNYIYLLHIIRHYDMKRDFSRSSTDPELTGADEAETVEPEFGSDADRRARLKAERAERKADDKKLRDRNVSKAEKDAIWLKRANQSANRKKEKEAGKNRKTYDMSEVMPFTGIKDGFIEYDGEYYGVAIEIPPVEFRFFSPMRRNNSIENGVGRVLRALPPEYSANIVKIERPIIYDEYVSNEYDKINDLRAAFERGMITEDELQIRIEVLCDRINDLRSLCTDNKVIQPFYYIVLFDSDKTQLNNMVDTAIDNLRTGELNPHRLDNKELAVFLKYSNKLDFDEHDVDKVDPERYAEWAMPDGISVRERTVKVNGILSHNLRIVNYPTQVGDAWLAGVLSIPSTKVVIKCKTMDKGKAVHGIDRSLQELREQHHNTGIDSKLIELEQHIDTLSSLLSTLQGDNETLLEVNIYITAYDIIATKAAAGDAADRVVSDHTATKNMKRTVRRYYQEQNLRLNNMDFDQLSAFIGSQISSYDPLAGKGRGIPSNSVAACYPWIYAHVADKKGVKLGTSDGVPVFIDFFRRDSERVNSNMVIVGKSGSGKSYATKSLLTNLAADDAKIFILDPENEYTELAANLHGKFINVANAQYGRLNPFHIITALDDDDSDGSSPSNSYATHLQFLEEFFRQILPDCEKDAMEYLNSLIDRMYTNKGITADTNLSELSPEDYPVFDDLYDAILTEFQATDNEYIRTMLRTLMNYVAKFSAGGRNATIWNGPSSVTTEENFTVFNFQSLLANRNGAIANAQMLLVLKYIDNEIIKNREYNTKYKLHRKVVVVIDEAHVFIDTKYPVALDFMFQLAKRIRKYNGMQIVITQNIKDFVGSEEIARKSTAIINACQYSFIFSLAPNDMDDLCRLYEKAGGINEIEQEQIVSAPRGQAFAVMSPQSRTTFRIDVPEDIVAMFSEPGFRTRYFNGEDGAQKWDDILGESRAIHSEAKKAETVSDNIVRTAPPAKKRVTFIEMTDEEAAAVRSAKAEREKAELLRLKAEAEALKAAEKEDLEKAKAAAEDAGNGAGEAVSEKAAPVFTAPAYQPVVPQVVVQAPAQSENTEKLLSELLGKFSYDAMREEIRRSVRDEMEKELSARGTDTSEDAGNASGGAVAAVYAEEAGSTADDESYDDLFEDELEVGDGVDIFAGDEDYEDDDLSDDTQEDDDSSFDIMQMLMEEAQRMENVSPIDMMLEYNEELLEIKLDELIQYNAKH